MPGGPALLAATTGAALLPASPWFTVGGWGLRVMPAGRAARDPLRKRVAAGTQALADVFARDIAEHPDRLAHAAAAVAGRSRTAARTGDGARLMRIGIVCPYSWDIPGGVQAHVRDLAEKLIALGHHVSVLAPGDEDDCAGPAALRRDGW